MAADDERLEQIKDWWQQYRWTVIGGVAIGILSVGGWTGWNAYTEVKQEAASVLFQELSVAVVQTDVTTAQRALQDLLADHSGSVYAQRARLLLARAAYDAGEINDAHTLLEEAVASSSDDATRHAARIRLAQLKLADEQYAEVLDLLDVTSVDSFATYYHELKGDAYRALNRNSEAQEAYQASIDALSPNSGYETILTLKLNDTLVAQ